MGWEYNMIISILRIFKVTKKGRHSLLIIVTALYVLHLIQTIDNKYTGELRCGVTL